MNFYECISRINSADSQYDIAISAFDLYELKEETRISDMVKERYTLIAKYIEHLKKSSKDNEKIDESKLFQKYGLPFGLHGGLLSIPKQQADRLKNSIRQNSLIVTLSNFEIFLNDLVRHILLNIPALLNSSRKIEIGRMIAIGTKKIVTEEVERQVYALDRKNIIERAEYFHNHLKLPWGKDRSNIDIVSKYNGIRNDIVHKDTNLQVDEEDLKEAIKTCKSIITYLLIGFTRQYKDIAAPLIVQK